MQQPPAVVQLHALFGFGRGWGMGMIAPSVTTTFGCVSGFAGCFILGVTFIQSVYVDASTLFVVTMGLAFGVSRDATPTQTGMTPDDLEVFSIHRLTGSKFRDIFWGVRFIFC